jgi:outer membrane protein assembly factor BamD (BamD/ComL family)
MARNLVVAWVGLAVLVPAGLLPAAEWIWSKDSAWVNVKERPSADHAARLAHASALIVRGDYAAALEQLNALQKEGVTDDIKGKAQVRALECMAHLGQVSEASQMAAGFIAEKPENMPLADLWRIRFLCGTLAATTQPQLSAKLLDEASAAEDGNPYAADALLKSAETHRFLGQQSEAIERCETFLGRYPESPDAAVALRLMGECGVDECAAGNAEAPMALATADTFEKYLKLRPDEPSAPAMQRAIKALRSAAAESSTEGRRVYYAVARYELGNTQEALTTFEKEASALEGTRSGEVAILYQALALTKLGRGMDAAEVCDKSIKLYPIGTLKPKVIEAEYAAGKQVLLAGESKGLEIMDRVIEYDDQGRGPVADLALLQKGKFHLDKKEFVDAKNDFDRVIDTYSGRESAAEALFRLGQARLGQAEYHPEMRDIPKKAREALDLYLRRYPKGAFAEEATALIAQCREREAQDTWNAAQFYIKKNEMKSAETYMNIIVREFEGTKVAEQAKAWLKEKGTEK